jgi:hypothetical protein
VKSQICIVKNRITDSKDGDPSLCLRNIAQIGAGDIEVTLQA